MTEIARLVAKAERFLKTAEAASALGDYDSCASRCYYAMFFLAEAVLLTRDLRASSHKGVIRLFGQHFVKPGIFGRELGRILNEAYDTRLRGDYATGFEIQQEEAQKMLGQAQKFVMELRSYLGEIGALGTQQEDDTG